MILQAYGRTLKNIASKHGVSPERIRQQRNRALITIRHNPHQRTMGGSVDRRTKYYQKDYTQPRVTIGGKPGSPVETTVLQRE